jgi:cell division protein ZipA
METGLRLLLLLLGFIIVAGIIWDYRRNRSQQINNVDPTKKDKFQKGAFNQRSQPRLNKEDQDIYFEEENLDSINDEIEDYDHSFEAVIIEKEKPSRHSSSGVINKTNATDAINPEDHGIIALRVLAKQSHLFTGNELLSAFKAAQLIYGEMQIFHRYANNAATENVLFSVISAVEPGTFDKINDPSFLTPGITLFFVLNHPNQRSTFELMLLGAKQLSRSLNAELRDDQNQLLTLETIEKYRKRFNFRASKVSASY